MAIPPPGPARPRQRCPGEEARTRNRCRNRAKGRPPGKSKGIGVTNPLKLRMALDHPRAGPALRASPLGGEGGTRYSSEAPAGPGAPPGGEGQMDDPGL